MISSLLALRATVLRLAVSLVVLPGTAASSALAATLRPCFRRLSSTSFNARHPAHERGLTLPSSGLAPAGRATLSLHFPFRAACRREPLMSNVRPIRIHFLNSRLKLMKSLLVALTAACFLTSCATVEKPIADSYNGPTAKVYDTMLSSDTRRGDFCVLEALDGRRIANSIDETLERGRGKGLTLYPWVTDRRVASQATKASLRCQTVYAAPILALTGTVFKVAGVVDFNPRPDGTYLVKGMLAESGSAVWIEDKETGALVTSKVMGSEDRPNPSIERTRTGRPRYATSIFSASRGLPVRAAHVKR